MGASHSTHMVELAIAPSGEPILGIYRQLPTRDFVSRYVPEKLASRTFPFWSLKTRRHLQRSTGFRDCRVAGACGLRQITDTGNSLLLSVEWRQGLHGEDQTHAHLRPCKSSHCSRPWIPSSPNRHTGRTSPHMRRQWAE